MRDPGKMTFSGAGNKRIKLKLGLDQSDAGTRGKEIENTRREDNSFVDIPDFKVVPCSC